MRTHLPALASLTPLFPPLGPWLPRHASSCAVGARLPTRRGADGASRGKQVPPGPQDWQRLLRRHLHRHQHHQWRGGGRLQTCARTHAPCVMRTHLPFPSAQPPAHHPTPHRPRPVSAPCPPPSAGGMGASAPVSTQHRPSRSPPPAFPSPRAHAPAPATPNPQPPTRVRARGSWLSDAVGAGGHQARVGRFEASSAAVRIAAV